MTSLKKKRTLIGCFIPDQLQVTELARHLIILRFLQKASGVSGDRSISVIKITGNLVNVLIRLISLHPD